VLVPLLVAATLMTIAAVMVAKVGQLAMRALGLELYGVLHWLGLAEAAPDELTARRRRTPAAPRSPVGLFGGR
jgi:hypothetical protein